MISIEYLTAALVIILVPGTGVIYTVSTGLIYDRLSTIYAALGCTVAITPHLLASIFGLATILNTNIMFFQIFKFLNYLVLFIFYI